MKPTKNIKNRNYCHMWGEIMTKPWKDSYDGILRAALGKQKLILPSIRAIIYNSKNDVLFIKRRGSGKWALPAGGMELDESIFECLQREVQEETGLQVVSGPLSIERTHGTEKITQLLRQPSVHTD